MPPAASMATFGASPIVSSLERPEKRADRDLAVAFGVGVFGWLVGWVGGWVGGWMGWG